MLTQLAREESTYSSVFRAQSEQASRTEPHWLRQLRENAFERFEQVGFPTVADEEWKYTNVAPIAKTNFAPPTVSSEARLTGENNLARFLLDEAHESQLVFVNGVFQKELSSFDGLPIAPVDLVAGVRAGQDESIVLEHLARYARPDQNGFTALNTALFSSGAFIRIPSGAKIDAPIHLLFISGSVDRATPFASFPRALIIVEKGSEATIIESYASVDESRYLNNAIVEMVVSESARLQHFRVQRESPRAFHVATTKVDVGRNAGYDTTAINLGAALSRHDIGVMMDHEGAECRVDGLYMVDGDQHTDTHSVIDHRQPRCTSHQLYKGILDGKSRAVFNGKVFVRHGAQQTDARQTNKNLLLSNEAHVDTKPQLEIFADDVKCAHGAAIGQLDEDEVFYLESRGINPALARNILTYGFAEEVIEKITIDSIKRELDTAVLHRLHASLIVD